MASAYPMLVRSALHQLREDPALYAHLEERQAQQAMPRPNLLLSSWPVPRAGARRSERLVDEGVLVPMLLLKAG